MKRKKTAPFPVFLGVRGGRVASPTNDSVKRVGSGQSPLLQLP